MATYTRLCTVQFASGLATVGYALYNADGTLNTARTIVGVAERGTTGTYGATVTLTTTWEGTIEWDDGEAVPDRATETIYPVTDVSAIKAVTDIVATMYEAVP